MEYHTHLTPESFKKAATQNADINNMRAKVTLLYMGVMFFLFACVTAYILYSDHNLGFFAGWAVFLTVSFVLAVLFGGLLGCLKIELSFRSAIKVSQANGAFDENVITLNDESITRTFSDGSSSHIAKSRVTDVYETNEFFIAKLGRYSLMIFEKDKMPTDSVPEFRKILSSYIDHEILVKNM
ncbi:YcxB family protein [Leuconostoc suionicum]|uniref:YcxB family protein n=1 Tax=Leuconostoc suionicum TaxID=1511761 RepID=UPI0021AB00C1|nr:YcxB family protein [Leuconostoc suionicum]MCT4383490.1 YcxB family protein [Leuconostoc suionicum]